MPELDPEDTKLVTLARAAQARTGRAQGACVRDNDGRTYSATTVDLKSLELTALQAAVAAAISSGAQGIEAAAIVGGAPDEAGSNAVHEISADALILLADLNGVIVNG